MARVALITGGAKGIGRGVARALGARGDRVAIAYRTSAAAAAETVAAIEAAGGRGLAVAADVADPTQAERLVAQVAATFGPPDVLVHAAGPYHRADVLAETPAGWREMIGGNLDSFFYCARACAPAMAERRWGRIVAFSMAKAEHVGAVPAVAAHYVAKVGLLALARTLARRLAPSGVTVNCLSPGYIDSGSAPVAELERALPTIPAGRLGAIDDLVAAVLYLLSDEAAYVTGANLTVSGAWGL
ncbi:MAG TPA: SDR family oxidoreductase [Haliangiales bacterium]|nr:SDR family oxidoreductase [Haliangiales bacterium]